jgi:hypothetical protein
MKLPRNKRSTEIVKHSSLIKISREKYLFDYKQEKKRQQKLMSKLICQNFLFFAVFINYSILTFYMQKYQLSVI